MLKVTVAAVAPVVTIWVLGSPTALTTAGVTSTSPITYLSRFCVLLALYCPAVPAHLCHFLAPAANKVCQRWAAKYLKNIDHVSMGALQNSGFSLCSYSTSTWGCWVSLRKGEVLRPASYTYSIFDSGWSCTVLDSKQSGGPSGFITPAQKAGCSHPRKAFAYLHLVWHLQTGGLTWWVPRGGPSLLWCLPYGTPSKVPPWKQKNHFRFWSSVPLIKIGTKYRV